MLSLLICLVVTIWAFVEGGFIVGLLALFIAPYVVDMAIVLLGGSALTVASLIKGTQQAAGGHGASNLHDADRPPDGPDIPPGC